MSALKAVEKILLKSEGPLHYREITKRMIAEGLWKSDGKTPAATVNAQIAVDIKKKGNSSKFVRVGEGIFALRGKTDLPSFSSKTAADTSSISFTDAAERILEKEANRRPMHYKDITSKALKAGLIKTEGQTPAATMYAQILTEIARHVKRGKQPRFVKYGKGLVGLGRWLGKGLAYQIEQHNRNARKKLLERVRQMDAIEFEQLVGQVLTAIGFDKVEVTKRSKDGGIDVRGTIVSGDVIRTNMAVQVKKWKNNVQAPTVQQVRGSVGAHEQGLVITTSDFSAGAKKEAERRDAAPVGLMNGEQFVELMIENDIGVSRSSHNIIDLADTTEGSEA